MILEQKTELKGTTLLSKQHFQVAYVTNDLDRALDVFSEIYKIKDFHVTRGTEIAGVDKFDFALAWAGDTMLEIIEGKENKESLYQRSLPKDEFAISFHHLGYFVQNMQEWGEMLDTIKATDRKIALSGSVPDLHFLYIEAPELGHYLEYVLPGPTWIEFFDSLPRN
jgi:hypothetical protein